MSSRRSSHHSSHHSSRYLQVPPSQPPRPPSSTGRAHSSAASARSRVPSLQSSSSNQTARRSSHRGGSSVHSGSAHLSPMRGPPSHPPSSLAPSDSISSNGYESVSTVAHGDRHNADKTMRHTPSYQAHAGPPQSHAHGLAQQSSANYSARAPSYAVSSHVSAQSLPPPVQRQISQSQSYILAPVAPPHMQALQTPQRHQGVYITATVQEETYTSRSNDGDEQTLSRRVYTEAQYYHGLGGTY